MAKLNIISESFTPFGGNYFTNVSKSLAATRQASPVTFIDAYSSWQRGAVENTNL